VTFGAEHTLLGELTAAPLIGSSVPIRSLRDRIERVATTDFTILIEGASGPQPHPSFIEVFGDAAFY
jgi:transcriptional regulator with AAA-type ATPase domain